MSVWTPKLRFSSDLSRSISSESCVWHRSSSPIVENRRLKSSSCESVRQIARLARVEGHRLGGVVVRPDHLCVASAPTPTEVTAFEDRDRPDVVTRGEVVGEGEAVDTAADDHDVVGGCELRRREERPTAQEPRHGGDPLVLEAPPR